MRAITVLIILWFCVFSVSLMAQTYYYKMTKVVDSNGTYVTQNSTGLFVSFNKNGCYDSDNEGYSMGYGLMKLESKGTKSISYYGNSYWGLSHFYFTPDYTVLNVKIPSGETLVYHKSIAKGQAKSTYYPARRAPKTNTPVIVPNIPNQTLKEKTIKNVCTYCEGKGKEPFGTYSYAMNIDTPKRWCSFCANWDLPHIHKHCSICHGTGYTRETILESE